MTATDNAPRRTAADSLRDGPILETLLRLTAPNLVALVSATAVTIAETSYVGRLGIEALAGVTLVFPVVMLNQMLSAGAMGGGISGALSRALGAGDEARARSIALCAALIGLGAGLTFSLLVFVAGPWIFAALGGRGAALEQAVAFGHVAAFGILAIWVTNCLASVLRASGDMATPATIILMAGVVQIVVGGSLGLGIGPLPRLGVAGVAAGAATGFTCAAIVLALRLRSSKVRVPLRFEPALITRAGFADILRVGLPASLSPLQAVGTTLILTALVARFGPEALAGCGVGTRLEFLLIPIAFSIGVASVPMVGTAIGAGDVARARRVAWTAASVAMVALAVIGLAALAAPDAWARLFISDERAIEATRQYLRIAGLGFPFFGLGLCLYFASQGAGKVGGPIVAQAARLAVVAIGGYLLTRAGAPLWTLFALTAFSMVVQGLGTALAVRLTRWEAPRATPSGQGAVRG
jgi:putative MATE family efflux protein